jgi:hypothetical protein
VNRGVSLAPSSITLALAALLGAVLLGGCGASPTPKTSSTGSTSAQTTRPVGCSDNTGVGNGSVAPQYLTMGDVTFNGLLSSGSQVLQTLSNHLLWDKTYIDVPHTSHHTIGISIRPLTQGAIGLDWGTQNVDESLGAASSTSLHVEVLHLDFCGSSGGWAGGFVMTEPLCAALTVTAGGKMFAGRVKFGNATCP